MPERWKVVEQLLETERPSDRPSRLDAVFLCARPEDSAFGVADGRHWRVLNTESVRLYRAHAIGAFAGPMALVEHIRRLLERGDNATLAAHEYWNHTAPWQCLEFVVRSCTILEEVFPIDTTAIRASRARVSADQMLARKLFPRQRAQAE